MAYDRFHPLHNPEQPVFGFIADVKAFWLKVKWA